MILVIDNYDSFTYNLVHLVATETADVRVVRNDEITRDGIRNLAPQGILISPGPGRPADAGITERVIESFAGDVPILGVCLGHQAIGEVFGGRIIYAPVLMHGKTSPIDHDGQTIFEGITPRFEATRYHSLAVEEASLPPELEVSARTADGTVMGLRHRTLDVEGIQFHPESVLTTQGPRLIDNWVQRVLQRQAGEVRA